MESKNCVRCGKVLDNPEDPSSRDCGGDCVECMAEVGDPGCQQTMYEILKSRLDKHKAAAQVLEGFWTGDYWKGVTRSEATDIARAFAHLNGIPFAERKQVHPQLVAALKVKGYQLHSLPFTPFDPSWEDLPVVKAIRAAEMETGIVFEHPDD